MSEEQTLNNLAHKAREALRYLEINTALQIFRDTLEIDDSFLDGWVGLGQAYYEMGKLKEAERAFKKAKNLVSKNAPWRVPTKKKLSWKLEKNRPVLRLVHGLGLLAFRRQDNKTARKWFEMEHSLDPSLEAPLVMLADIEAGKQFNKLKYQHLNV